jgi:hypothetical protein
MPCVGHPSTAAGSDELAVVEMVPARSIMSRLKRDVLHDGDGVLADERDRHRVGAYALARDAASGVGGLEAGG